MSTAETSVVTPKPLAVEYTDSKGVIRKARLSARIIKATTPFSDEREDTGAFVPAARGSDEEELRNLAGKIIQPPYNLRALANMPDRSTELGQAIQAMVINTVGFGWQLRERPLLEESPENLRAESVRERFELRAKLDTVHPTDSLTALRKRVNYDKHACGNGYLELIGGKSGELVGLDHVPGHSIRLAPKEKVPTKVTVPRVRPDKGFAIEEIQMNYRFRKFVQVRNNSVVWFREAGDNRVMSCETGEYETPENPVPPSKRATSLLHFKIYHPSTAYGVPLWIGNTLSVLGSRASEEINYATINNNGIPAMMVIVENGVLTEGSIDRLTEWTETHIQQGGNFSKFIILEGETLDEGSPNPGSFRIKIEKMTSEQVKDQLFQEYDQNNRDKVRQCFRLPPIFVGRAEDYTRATADTSRDIGDEQIFAPERSDDDYSINRFVLSAWDARFHLFRSNHPNITDDIELIRLMAIAERSGAMTPRRANRIVLDVFGDDIGPMPEGVELDRPFSLQFAESQKGPSPGSSGQGSAPSVAQTLVDNLLDMRTKIEKELDSRLYGDDFHE